MPFGLTLPTQIAIMKPYSATRNIGRKCIVDIFREILYWINQVVIVLFCAAFFVQVIYVLLFFLKPKRYAPAKEKHKIAIMIPARNESAVIGDTVRALLQQNYPADRFHIYVVADNCTDNTAQLAREAGATVYERFDDDPSHKRASYAMQHGFRRILEDDPEVEFFIKFDADNAACPDYLSRMNDAYESGVKIARPYSNSKNIGQNMWAGISGLYYLRDSRFSCQVRSALGSDQMLTGAGMMVSADILRRVDGWDAMSTSDDSEFTLLRLMEGERIAYVSEAICYEDQPTTLKDTFNRNRRMGNGLNKVFFRHGFKFLFHFFRYWRWSYIDLFLQMMFVPMALAACFWFPAYYIFDFCYQAAIGDTAAMQAILINLAYVLAFGFYVPFVLQGLLAAILERKRLLVPWTKLLPTIICFPLFMIIYAISITLGILHNPQWKSVARNAPAMAITDAKAVAADVDPTEETAQDSSDQDEPTDTDQASTDSDRA